MPVTFPNPTDVNSVVSLFSYNNSITNGLFMTLILLTIWVVLFMTLKMNWRTEAALGASSSVTVVLAILLRGASLVTDGVVIVSILIFVGSSVFVILSNPTE